MSPIPRLILDTPARNFLAPGVRSHPAIGSETLRNAWKRLNAASTLATLVTDRKRTCGVRRLDNGISQSGSRHSSAPEIFDCLSINDGERAASTRDHLRYFASSFSASDSTASFSVVTGKEEPTCDACRFSTSSTSLSTWTTWYFL